MYGGEGKGEGGGGSGRGGEGKGGGGVGKGGGGGGKGGGGGRGGEPGGPRPIKKKKKRRWPVAQKTKTNLYVFDHKESESGIRFHLGLL